MKFKLIIASMVIASVAATGLATDLLESAGETRSIDLGGLVRVALFGDTARMLYEKLREGGVPESWCGGDTAVFGRDLVCVKSLEGDDDASFRCHIVVVTSAQGEIRDPDPHSVCPLPSIIGVGDLDNQTR